MRWSIIKHGMTLLGVAMIVGIFWLARDAMQPTLFEGDRQEQVKCRLCTGLGYRPNPDGTERFLKCPYCWGNKLVTVIVPGPHRPTKLWGLVVDREKAGDPEYYTPESVRKPLLAPTDAPGIYDATVVFRDGAGKEVKVKTADTGRFRIALSPGSYSVEISARGYETYRAEEPLVIAPLTAKAWTSKTRIESEIGEKRELIVTYMDPELLSEEEVRSSFGLLFVSGVSSEEADRGFWKTYFRDQGETGPEMKE